MVIGNNNAGTAEIASLCTKIVLLYNNQNQLIDLMQNISPKRSIIENEQKYANNIFSCETSTTQLVKYYLSIL